VEDDSLDTRNAGPEARPDPAAFAVLEEFLVRAYRADAATHLWLWGSDTHRVGWGGRSGTDGLGGGTSRAVLRLYRYLAGRLGPIPGWSVGYGHDLQHWTDPAILQEWYDYQKRHLGGWAHPLGGRSDAGDSRRDDRVHRGRLEVDPGSSDAVFWTGGDYLGLYHYRVPYQWYRATLAFGAEHDLAVLQEDRFRVRESEQFVAKDYTPDLTRRGLWHSMMAGGVGNIWGNLLPGSDHRGSRPYDNRASGSVQGIEVTVDEKEAIRAWHWFWFDERRFRSDYRTANRLTNDEPGPTVWDTSPTGEGIAVGLAAPDDRHYVFYREGADALRMDLRGMLGPQPAAIVDVRSGEVTERTTLEPALYEGYELDESSDWAVAVGEFGAGRDRKWSSERLV